ncbi:SH3 domain-containing protein [Chitinophaga sp. GbtcB8]|uniref:SH3 domain-containing protein n=1 Tax=Chitinophaga sp. GbtcB8 TaxID=2824753 RepID=UPI001C2F22D7|nr:SH3 domain-containing protein [Chitinophaga sp. GbtcB8]
MTRTGTDKKDTRTYVNLHADGVYYRKKITGDISYTPSQVHTYYQPGDNNIIQHTITSAPVDQLTDIDSKDFIDELNIKSSRSSYLNWFGILPAILFCIFLIAHYSRIAKVAYDKKYIVTIKEAKTGINIRLDPDKKNAVVGGALKGDQFDLVDSTKANWYEINHREMNAYISREYAAIDSLNINKRTYSGFEVESDSFIKWFLAGML